MTAYVNIKSGKVRGKTIKNTIFPVVKNFSTGKNGTFITVDGSKVLGGNVKNVRVAVDPEMVSWVEEADYTKQCIAYGAIEANNEVKVEMSEEERMTEIEERFDILHDMTKAMMRQKIRGMIVSGPPGVGKSFGVERELDKMNTFTDLGANGGVRKTEVVKGAMSALGLYCKLHEFRNAGDVLVFDDCDSVLMDDLSLNLLKAALDSGRTRKIYWNADSAKLRAEGIENSFEFKGSVIFITNINFEHVRSKKLQDHLQALMSRCHYLDLTLHTMKDKMLRVKQIARKGALFTSYKFKKEEEAEILDFMFKNVDILREVSLRMALKIADCKVVNGDRWKVFAKATCMKN